MYTETVMDHFTNPRNVGKIALADGVGMVGDAGCGDQLTVYVKISRGTIQDIRFLVYGCAASIATSSMTTVLAKGKTLEDALKITEDDIINALGGLPEEKHHCSNLGVGALKAAIQDYQMKKPLSWFQKFRIKLNRTVADNREKLIHHMMVRFNGKRR